MIVECFVVLIGFVFGYLLGSLNAAVIVGRVYGKDIREHGSKGAGLTNTLRVLGKPAAAIVLLGDTLKGVLACLIGLYLSIEVQQGDARDSISLLAAGFGVVLGHNWPIYFGFKGGKGILTGVTVLFFADWRIASACLAVFIVVVASTRYVSLGSVLAASLFFVLSLLAVFEHTIYFGVFSFLMASVAIFRHKENIQRLLSGSESKLTFQSRNSLDDNS